MTQAVTARDGPFARARRWVRGLTGWRALCAGLALGAASTLALPPWHAVPVLVVTFAGLLWLVDGARGPRAAATVGWAFGAGFFGSGLHWIGNAFMVDADRFGALAVPAVAGLAIGLALFIAIVAGVARAVPAGLPRALALAGAWVGAEWLRGHILSGFPWNLLATVWAPFDPMNQAAALAGAYGLSLATALILILPATLDRRATAAAILLLLLLWGGGAWRLAGSDGDMVEGIRLRLVQAAIDQRDKWRDDLRAEHLIDQIALSREPAEGAITHVIWPEAAIAFLVEERADVRAAMAEAVPPGGALVTGTVRRTWDATDRMSLWNSVAAIDGEGAVIATYDKAHLVPFGEYVPLRDLVGLAKLTQGSIDFSAGPGPVVLRLPGLPPFSPLVCYEAIFPGSVRPVGERPDWLLNLTNDAWFGTSVGPRQHLAAARLRTIEEGLPLVRAAGSGISAVIDPYGRITASLDLGRRGVLDSGLPRPLPAAPLYARIGDLALIPPVMILLGAIVLGVRRGRLDAREGV